MQHDDLAAHIFAAALPKKLRPNGGCRSASENEPVSLRYVTLYGWTDGVDTGCVGCAEPGAACGT